MPTNRLVKLEMPAREKPHQNPEDKVTPNQLLTLSNFKGILVVI